MKNYRLIPALFILFISLLFLTQCDMIIGSSGNANVTLDLGEFIFSARGVNPPQPFSSLSVGVFGPGMQAIQKTVSAGSRYINLSIPAGPERHFTVELFLQPPLLPPLDIHPHLVSLKGRAIADLLPGRFTSLRMKMVAGATQLLVPDYTNSCLFLASDFPALEEATSGNLSYTGGFNPNDIDFSSNGIIFVANDDPANGIVFAHTIDGNLSPPTYWTLNYPSITALAIDRNAQFDIDRDIGGTIDTNVLYFYSSESTGNLYFKVIDGTPPYGTTGVYSLTLAGINSITGLAVDPWTHRLYMVGALTGAGTNWALIEYDPFYSTGGALPTFGRIVRSVTISTDPLHTLEDVIVKDDGIFVLSRIDVTTPDPPGSQIPVVRKFDRNLNLIQTFGRLSYVPDGTCVESYNTGDFYHPKRFFAQENRLLYITDDGDLMFDKVVSINTDLAATSWQTFPSALGGSEPFIFIENNF